MAIDVLEVFGACDAEKVVVVWVLAALDLVFELLISNVEDMAHSVENSPDVWNFLDVDSVTDMDQVKGEFLVVEERTKE